MISEATICHFTNGRLRLKIVGRREDHRYFQSVQEKLHKAGYVKTGVNSLTGSIVLESENISVEEVFEFGKKTKLFALKKEPEVRKPLFRKITMPFSEINADLKKVSGGDIDLPIAIFILLLSFGVIEILRGNFKMPPWYTALWYAFGVFSKSIFDSRQKNNI